MTLYYQDEKGTRKEASVGWHKIPIEALLFYRNTRYMFRIGGGLTYQFVDDTQTSHTAFFAKHSFSPSAGFIAQTDFVIGDEGRAALGARYAYDLLKI
jgi:hypothetical protein